MSNSQNTASIFSTNTGADAQQFQIQKVANNTDISN